MKQRIRVDSGNAAFVKWNEVKAGRVFVGTYGGQHEGQYGPLAALETAEGPLVLPVPAALARSLARVRVGGEVEIVYEGKKVAKSGRDFHAFSVFVGDEADRLPPQSDHDEVEPF
jgi:hypothetical protein